MWHFQRRSRPPEDTVRTLSKQTHSVRVTLQRGLLGLGIEPRKSSVRRSPSAKQITGFELANCLLKVQVMEICNVAYCMVMPLLN
jgi:hypothetical protein